jgi:endonuclease/exonuclease/phosphatase family metal-dependent hydrolase
MLLFSLNVEGSRHLKRWLPLVKFLSPDVVCLQEVLRKDLSLIRRELAMDCEFAPQQRLTGQLAEYMGGPGEIGIALFSPHGLTEVTTHYYRKPNVHIIPSQAPEDSHRALLTARIRTPKETVRVGTVHFTWSANGENTLEQAADLKKLMSTMDRYESLLVAGDLNIPRDTHLFRDIEQKFAIWTPERHESSLDEKLHRSPEARVVVDHILSSHDLKAENVDFVDGLSDHKAIIGHISQAVSVYHRDVI